MKIGIFLPNWIGDVVMATPTLRALRGHFGPDAQLTGIMRPYAASVLSGTDWLDDQWVYFPNSKQKELRCTTLVRRLRSSQLDLIVLLTNSMRTGLLAWLSGAKQRVGYARYGRRPLLTDPLTFPKAHGKYIPTPTLDTYLELAYRVGCPKESPRTELATLPEDEQRADEVWRHLDLPRGREVVVLNSGGAYGAAKAWPEAYFSELAQRIAERHDRTVLVLCGPSEREAAARIALAAGHRRVKSLADQRLSIGLTKACVRRSQLMVSTDSGPRHFAAAFDVPVVTLYGPTHIAWGDTHYPRAVHLQHEVPCGPCMKRVCPLGHHRCMTDLRVDDVFRAVQKMLAKESHKPEAA